jgi:hypothetical protein
MKCRCVCAFKRVVLTWAFFVMCALGLHAAPTLQWDPNPEPDIAGYKVYIGTLSGQYSRSVDVGPLTSYLLAGLNAGETHYLAVTAYTSAGIESPFSDEVIYTPAIDGITSRVIPSNFIPTDGTATIQFPGILGQRVRILATSDFETWTQVYSTTVTLNGVVSFSDGAMNRPARFYRVVISLLAN